MIEDSILELKLLIENNKPYTFSFNTNQLPDNMVWEDDSFIDLFQNLHHKGKSCLYWFSLESNETGNMVKEFIDLKRDWFKSEKRVIPAKNKNWDSNILYVGIRRGGRRKRDELPNILGRIIQHLGYYDVGSTQSLQLKYWARELNLNITLNVIEFENLSLEKIKYLNIVEQLYAMKLKPVLGKH